ncbi:hypothetical protein GCQ56_14735 [Marinifilum sp. N1E240]|uniref:hypothetical protein n=1 Tax=Marinifilum sp. N1E240 TaxID=2608082 RepID=UPI00128C5CDB|nr:hypothetical protein [Marinifilum sp. N1E240]MPQ48257.1 hypothetical protein [Marinifilum sp. N1E240]
MRKIITILLVLSNLGLGAFLILTFVKDRDPISHPFDVNFNMTKKSLLKNGYKTIPEDVPLLGKRIGDTFIYYQFDEEYDIETEPVKVISDGDTVIENWSTEKVSNYRLTNIRWRHCEIRINNPDSTQIEEFIRKYNGYIISDWNMENPRFFVRNKNNNLIYDCSLQKDQEFIDVLAISLFFPKIQAERQIQ